MRTFSFSLWLVVFLLLAGQPTALSQEPTPADRIGEQSTIPDNRGYHLYLPGIALDRTIFYVDGNQGDDSNPGTQESPWQSIAHAIASIKSGDTVIIASGIYQLVPGPTQGVPGTLFGPAGKGFDQPTTFRSASNARVIFTAPDGTPPTLHLLDYVRLEGLWFGGYKTNDDGDQVFFGGSPIGNGKQFVNNTFFGYTQVLQGSSQYPFFQGNRFVFTGKGQYAHPLYLSGGYKEGSMSNHAIVDNNIFIGDEGWAIHGWHNARSNIVTRNFVAGQYYALVMDGSDHLIANNFFWRQNGQPGHVPFAAWLPGDNIITMNNIFAYTQAGIAALGPNPTVRDNVFLAANPVGENAIVLQPGEERAQLGVSAEEIDGAIAQIRASFSQSVEGIYNDDSIEPAFAVLKTAIPDDSTLFAQGDSWFLPRQAINIGPDTPAPVEVDTFWQSFRELGLKDYDRFGQIVDP